MLQARVSTSIYKETIWAVERFQNQAIKTSKFKREGVLDDLDVLVKKESNKKGENNETCILRASILKDALSSSFNQ